jgi:hypothetical protein
VTPSGRLRTSWRWLAYTACAGVLALLYGVVFFGLTSLALAWFQTREGVAGPVTEVGYGVLVGIFLTVGLASQLRHADRNVAGLQQASLVVPALLIGSALAGDAQNVEAALIVIVGVGVLIVLKSERGELLRIAGTPDPWLVGMVLVAAVPLVWYAVDVGAEARDLTGPPHHVQRLSTMAAMAVAIVLVGFLAAARTKGWTLPAWCAGIATVLFGLASLLYPTHPGTAGAAWGGLAMVGGALFIGVATSTSKRHVRSTLQ